MTTKVRTPLILVNLKSYSEAIGRKAMRLAEIADRISLETGVCIGLAPQFTDIASIANAVTAPVFAQHIDPIMPGSFTGYTLPESIREAGAIGTLINHSERRLRLADIETTINRARDMDLLSVVCANNATVSGAAAVLEPSMIAMEPPELIGTGIPVSKARPEVVSDAIDMVRSVSSDIIVLCGAGITSGDDITAALKLGTEGVLVSSAVVEAKDQYKVLFEFARAAARE